MVCYGNFGEVNDNDQDTKPMGPKRKQRPKPKAKDKEIPNESLFSKRRIKLYVTLAFASIFITAFTALMFLVPFVIDPSLAAIRADFVEAPVDCKVIRSQYVLGKSFIRIFF